MFFFSFYGRHIITKKKSLRRLKEIDKVKQSPRFHQVFCVSKLCSGGNFFVCVCVLEFSYCWEVLAGTRQAFVVSLGFFGRLFSESSFNRGVEFNKLASSNSSYIFVSNRAAARYFVLLPVVRLLILSDGAKFLTSLELLECCFHCCSVGSAGARCL